MSGTVAAHTPRYFVGLQRALIAGYGVAAAILCGAAIWYAVEDRAERIASATRNAEMLARALDEHVQRSFDAVNLLLIEISGDIAARGGLQRIAPGVLHRELKAKLNRLPQVWSLYAFGPDSIAYAGSHAERVPRIDGSGFEDVAAHRKIDAPPVALGRPRLTPVTRVVSVPVSRRIDGPGGGFGGVVGANLDLKYFDRFYHALKLEPGYALLLARADGILLIRYPELPTASAGTDLSGSAIYERIASADDAGTAREIGALTGRERVVAFRMIASPPLIVAVSFDVDEVVARWRRDATAIAAGVAGVLAALALLLWIALRQIASARLAEAEVLRLNESLDQDVRRRTAELKTANADLESFSYSVSHDLRAPLRAMAGFSTLLRTEHGERLGDEGRALLARIETAALRMSALIDALLALARVSRQPLRKSRVDLSALARDVAAEIGASQPQRAVALDVASGLTAHADPELARIALHNLLENAWKYTAMTAHPQIELAQEATARGERVFFVRDNGAGFDMARAAQLFSAFHRLHDDPQYHGTGIGLATVARIISRHGGRIWAEAEPGRGATFRFVLPDDEEPRARQVT